MELTLTALFFFVFGAFCLLFTQLFWIHHSLKTGKVVHFGRQYVVMELGEFRHQLTTVTDLRILCDSLKEEVAVLTPPEKKIRKPRVSNKKEAAEV